MEYGRIRYLPLLLSALLIGGIATIVGLLLQGGPTSAVFVSVMCVVAVISQLPLAEPVGRRVVDVVGVGLRRASLAVLVLFAVRGLVPSRMPDVLALAGVALVFAVLVPAIGLAFRASFERNRTGTVVVGDDPAVIATAAEQLEGPVTGVVRMATGERDGPVRLTDGAVDSRSATVSVDELAGSGTRLGDALDSVVPARVVLAFSDVTRDGAFAVLESCHDHDIPVVATEPASDRLLTGSTTDEGFVEVHTSPLTQWQELEKRAFDVAFAVVGLVAVTPLVPLLALAVRLDSPGPILYRQVRTERFGNRFVLPKFRTMVENAESETGAVIMDDDEDSRITRVGAVLRTTYLDEIPQLVSVLVGRMSAVGPRPERPELDTEWTDDVSAWPRRWHVKPGLTGFAQVDFEGFDEGRYAADNLRADDQYMAEWSLWLDCKLVAMQIGKLFGKFGGG